MGDTAATKVKKSKKHGEETTGHESSAPTAVATHGTQPAASLAPQIVVQGVDGADPSGKQRRASKSSHSSSTTKTEEKVKDKVKDKERRKLAKEASHNAQTQAVEKTADSAFLHEGVVYKHAGRLKGTQTTVTGSFELARIVFHRLER